MANRKGYREVTKPDGSKTTVKVGDTAEQSYDSSGGFVGNKSGSLPKASKKLTKLSVKLADDYYKKNPQLAKSGGYKGKVNTDALLKKTGPSTALRNLSKNLAKGNITGASPTNTNTTQGVTESAKGKPLGTGTPLNDDEIDALEKQGYREGDFVPGRGRLLPDGTFDASTLTKANQLRQQESSAVQGAIASDAPIVQQEKSSLKTVEDSTLKSPTKEALTLLDAEIKNNKDNLRQNISSLKDSAQVTKAGVQANQANETGQASVNLANAGGYLGFSGGAQGVMLSLAESHRAELASLDAKRDAAIQEARNAAANRQFDLVRLKAAEITRIDQETYDRQEAYNKRVREETAKETAKQEKLQVQNSINDVVQYFRGSGTKDFTPEDIFNELNGTVPIESINDFFKAIVPKGDNIFKFTPTQTASLLGAGMSADDVSALNEYVATNGYDEKVRAALTPAQRLAADKVFRAGSGLGSGSATDFTDQEKRKLEQAGLLTAPRQDQLDYLYASDKEKPYESVYTGQILEGGTTVDALPLEVQEEVRKELYNVGFGSDVVPQWYKDYEDARNMQTVDAGTLKSNWTTYRKKALGENIDEGESGGSWWSNLW